MRRFMLKILYRSPVVLGLWTGLCFIRTPVQSISLFLLQGGTTGTAGTAMAGPIFCLGGVSPNLRGCSTLLISFRFIV